MLPEANTQRQEEKNQMIKVLPGCILKLLLHSVNSVHILYSTGNMQSAILLSFVSFSSLPQCDLQSTHPQMLCYVSQYITRLWRAPKVKIRRRLATLCASRCDAGLWVTPKPLHTPSPDDPKYIHGNPSVLHPSDSFFQTYTFIFFSVVF